MTCRNYFSEFTDIYRFVAVILGFIISSLERIWKRQQQYFEKLHGDLQVGKRVICANGLYGTVKKLMKKRLK